MNARRILPILALLPFLYVFDLAHAAPWTTRTIDDFDAGHFPVSSPMNWVQTGLPLESCWAGRREISVNDRRTITAEIPDLMYQSYIEVGAGTGPLPELPNTTEEVIRLDYEFGITRDLTGGGVYDRIRINIENIHALRFYVEVGLKANTYPDVVSRRVWSQSDTPGRDFDVVFLLSDFAPQINPQYVESITVRVETETFNSTVFRLSQIDLAGPLVFGEVDTDDGGHPTASLHNAKYFEEWSWPDLPSPGPVTATLDVELIEDDLNAGGEYPGWLSWADDSNEDAGQVGTLSHTTLAADALNPYPDGTFEFKFRWSDVSTGMRMFYPPDPVKILSDKHLLLTVNSHHESFDTGNETQLLHQIRVKIPEGSPVIFADVYEVQNDESDFGLHFQVINVDPGAGAGPPVFAMSHTTDAGPYDASTATATSVGDTLRLTATPSVTDGRTRIALSQPLAFASTVRVYDVRGRSIRRIALAAGRAQVVWDGRDESGQRLASGVYFARVDGAPRAVKKITLLR